MQFLCSAETKLKVSGIGENTCSQLLEIIDNYLGIDFSYNGAWDAHIKKLIQNSMKVNQLHSIISNRNINLSARCMLLLSVLRPNLEYGSAV